VTDAEFDFLRGFLKSRSGLALAPEKRYLVESRLAPVCQKHRLATLADLVARLRPLPDPALARAVVEAMTTNETFFFRDRVPSTSSATCSCRAVLRRRRRRAACASGAPPPRPARSPIPWP